MINKLSHRTALWLASLATLLASTSPALAQNHSWTWPLYVRHDAGPGLTPTTGEPRPALWNSAGEYQNFTDVPYMHPGHDIRGNYGDIVVNPTAGSLQRIYNYADDCLMTGSACRLWLATEDGKYLYYVSHVDFAEKPSTDATQPVTEIREIFEAVHDGSATAEQRKIAQNTVLSSLTNFPSADWHHVHLGIVGHQTVVTIEMPDGPECHLAVDGGNQRSVNLGIPVVIESHDHASEPRMMRDILCLYPIQPEPPMASVFRNESRVTIHRVTAWAEIPGGEAESP